MAADDLGVFSVYDRRVGILLEVRRDQRLFGKAENSGEFSSGRVFQGFIHFFAGRFLVDVDYYIDERNIRRGNADTDAVEFSFNSGSTSDTAFAAPVEVGIMFKAAARARRRSLWGKSSNC